LAFNQRRSEADGEATNADALKRGGKKMSCFMHHDQESKNQEGRKYVHPADCCSVNSFWLEPFKADVWHQGFGKENASV
jgi:hypothetical protein